MEPCQWYTETIVGWKGTRGELFITLLRQFSEFISPLKGDMASIQDEMKAFLNIMYEFGLFAKKRNEKISINGTDTLEIISNGDTFKIVGTEDEMIPLITAITASVLERRAERRMSGEEEAPLEIFLSLNGRGEGNSTDNACIENIIGVQFLGEPPAQGDFEPLVIYPVEGFSEYDQTQKTGYKTKGKVWQFDLSDGSGQQVSVPLTLDDENVVFIEGRHLDKIRNITAGYVR